jgi:subfamily B ATP-binding cassette protein MsbA
MFQRLRPYFKYLKEVRSPIFAALFYAILFAASSGLGLPLLIKYVFPPIFNNELPKDLVIQIVAAIPVAFLLRAWSSYRNSYFTQYAGVRILESLRSDYFRKLQILPLSFLQKQSSGDLISRGLADTAQLQTTITSIANDGIKQPFNLIGALIALAWIAYDSEGALVVLGCVLIIPLSVLPIRYVGRKIIKRAQALQGQLGSVTDVFSENLSAAREVRAFCLEQRESDRFAKQAGSLVSAQMKIAKYALALTPAIEFISALGIAMTLVLAYGSGLKLETFISIVTALYLSYEPIKKLAAINSDIKRAQASLDRLEVVLNEPLTIADPEKPVTVTKLRGDIRFEKLTFAYKEGEPVLSEVEADIPAGTVCALVGPSGAGKTTFANLVPRFYEAGLGAVRIDGIDVRDMRLADLRRNIAIVSQDPVLFNDTIFNNLQLGRPEATRGEIEQAARDAFAHDFIVKLEGGLGYDTMVGERGGRLSGGQKQRIALARAFLRRAPVLILDEATSALDSESEAFIQQALKKLVQGKTVLIIAHRFSTIRDASMILVFEKGRIAARGSHAELYGSNPLYRKLYDGQSGAQG